MTPIPILRRHGAWAGVQTVAVDRPHQATVIGSPEGWSNSEFGQSDNAWMNEQRVFSATSCQSPPPSGCWIAVVGASLCWCWR